MSLSWICGWRTQFPASRGLESIYRGDVAAYTLVTREAWKCLGTHHYFVEFKQILRSIVSVIMERYQPTNQPT